MGGDKGNTTGKGGGTERGSGGGESHYETVKRSGTLTEVVRRDGPNPEKKEKSVVVNNPPDPNEPNRTN